MGSMVRSSRVFTKPGAALNEIAKRDGAKELDLGGLGLMEIPEELNALTRLKVL
jgi:hypothetical protein